MPSRAVLLLSAAILFAISGSVLFLCGTSLPIPPVVTLIAGLGCFILVIITTILALYSRQQQTVVESRA
jgi:hypothetical protein